MSPSFREETLLLIRGNQWWFLETLPLPPDFTDFFPFDFLLVPQIKDIPIFVDTCQTTFRHTTNPYFFDDACAEINADHSRE